MSARLYEFPPHPQEPMRQAEPQMSFAAEAAIIGLWLVIAFGTVVAFAWTYHAVERWFQ